MASVTPEGSTAASSSFSEVLAEEQALVQSFVDVLKREQISLSQGQTDDLPAHIEEKTQIATRLNELARLRNSILEAHGFSTDKKGVEAWCAQRLEKKDGTERWSKILAVATEARELNRINGDLIQLRLQYNARALEALQGGKNALDLYGPDGQATPRSNRRINDAV